MFVDHYEYVALTVLDDLLGFADKTSFLNVEGFIFLLLFFVDGFIHGIKGLKW